jgi:predicted murein hydrolase (TIGR00659 family)
MKPEETFTQLWVYLGTSPLLWLTLTVWAYVLSVRIQRALGGAAWANPVMLSVGMLVCILKLSHTPYAQYFEGAKFVHFLLGTATVSLAIPLRRHWHQVRSVLGPTVAAVVVGNVVSAVIAMGILHLWGAPSELTMSIAPKSVTAPVAMGISEKLGGLPALTAVLVILTGILGATGITVLLKALKINDPARVGLALGVASHGIGTARAFQIDQASGTFAGVGMALSTLAASLLVPFAAQLFMRLSMM